MAECQMQREPREARTRPPRPPPIAQSRNDVTDVRTFQRLHDLAYKYINKGLALDEVSNTQEALNNYQKGLEKIMKGLEINVESLICSEDEKTNLKVLQQKMTKTKLQIEYRIQSLTQTLNGISEGMEVEAPPSYEESMSSPGTISEEAFLSLGDSIMGEQSSDDSLSANAEEIFCVPDGVQIFFITKEGFVSAPSYPSSLKMFRFTEPPPPEDQNRPPAFLKVDNWIYPLVPGMSPALHATNGSYIFPDVTANAEGSSVGLLLPPDATPSQRQQFEQTLASLTALLDQTRPTAPPLEQEPSAPPMELESGDTHVSVREETTVSEEVKEKTEEGTSTKIAKGITVASQWISWGLEKGSEKAGHFIRLGSNKIREHLTPEEPKPVDPKVQKGAEYARKGAHVAVSVSSYVVTKLGQATVAVAKEVAPHIRRHGQKLLPDSIKSKTPTPGSNSKVDKVVDGAVEVAASSLKGFGTVYLSLETAAKALARNLANETVTVVNHKYGSEAAKLSENALYAVGNVAMTAYNVDNLGVKAIAKRAAKDTGKELVKDIHKEWKGASKTPSQSYSSLKNQPNNNP